jgi:hypothetical protein
MAIYRTDRERRILGDRIIARKDTFAAIHDVVGMVHGKLKEAHTALGAAIDARQKEESDDQRARRERDDAAVEVQRLYAWAYNQIDALLSPSWDDPSEEVEAGLLRETMFPLGVPSTVADSVQLTVDAMQSFLAQVAAQQSVSYPAPFLERCHSALAQLRSGIDNVTTEMGESAKESERVIEARANWDRAFTSLRDVTNGLLRLEGREAELAGFFRTLPRASAEPDQNVPTLATPT